LIEYTVELFGLSSETTALREVQVELKNGASLTDLVAALRRKIPALEGGVIRTGEDRLSDYYAFNINGRFYVDEGEPELHNGDHIMLLALSLGG